ncbi:MAG: aminopeptidase N [Rhodobacteraceae bacterium]|nr:MAG: aminopeptidase N [Paracoccaceae bacterium]
MNKINTTTYLKDYKPSPFSIKSVDLTFKLSPKRTQVTAKILFSPKVPDQDLELDGVELELKKVTIDGKNQDLDALIYTVNGLTVPKKMLPASDFFWEAETNIVPDTNSALEGLYRSAGVYCTQCEAQGFRKITYFLDRPDILAVYTVRIEGKEPILLSNGNLVESRPGFAKWYDPWPKPSYLFALVAGNLTSFNDKFQTVSGRIVDLRIYVRPEDIDKCAYAMGALKRSMRWDEIEYKREYDLDLFMIVAIDDFNMGAMENKGLNIFNSKYILADDKTATDKDYENIERIIAHEYFHNWTGNRITCRDWFQLCLKEGLTVFRDQQFSAEMRGFPITRIEDVLVLQAQQFREDDGPLSHPVRPTEYLEINNFYTATVYEKGAELVRMLKLIVGKDHYDKALQEYFVKFDGQACTVEDWLEVFERTAKINLSQFALWYHQKGRPIVEVTDAFKDGTFTMTFSQKLANNKNYESMPMLIPINIGLLNKNGDEIRDTETFLLSKNKQSITFDGLSSKPIPSTLRDFSAPITIIENMSDDELHILGGYDKNLFHRWNVLRQLTFKALERFIYHEEPISTRLLSSLEKTLYSNNLSPAYRALIVTPPSANDCLTYLSSKKRNIDPLKIHAALHSFNRALFARCNNYITDFFHNYASSAGYETKSEQKELRALKLKLMDLFCHCDEGIETLKKLHRTAFNMTDEIGSLALLIKHDSIDTEADQFYEKWKLNNNVIDKWFSTQAVYTAPEKSFKVVSALTNHKSFKLQNPNRFRSLIGAFAANNFCGFHQSDGTGYKLVADWLIKLDRINPQTAARVCTAFDNWKLFDSERQIKMKKNLRRIARIPNISKNSYEITNSILKK